VTAQLAGPVDQGGRGRNCGGCVVGHAGSGVEYPKVPKGLSQYSILAVSSGLSATVTRPFRLKWMRSSTLWVYRVVTWSVLAAGLIFAGVVLTLRYWILPNIEHYREDIARIVSKKAGQKVTIGRISANWDGLRPQLMLEQVTVHDAGGRPALELSRVDHTLSWLSIPTLQLRFHSLEIHSPTLNIQR